MTLTAVEAATATKKERREYASLRPHASLAYFHCNTDTFLCHPESGETLSGSEGHEETDSAPSVAANLPRR
jgi:hypothetical protein